MNTYSSLLNEQNLSKRSKEIGQECAEKAMKEFEKELLTPNKKKNNIKWIIDFILSKISK